MTPFTAIIFSVLSMAPPPAEQGIRKPSVDSTVVTVRVLDANRIALNINSTGHLDLNSDFMNAGSHWFYQGRSLYPAGIVFDHGPWIIGKVNGQPFASVVYWQSSFAPGPIIDGRPATWIPPYDSSRYHPYRLFPGDARNGSPDLTAWPFDIGAPVDSAGRALTYGDGMVWSVFNGGDSSRFSGWWPVSHSVQLPVEVRQSVFEHAGDDTSLLANCAFLDWRFYNKGATAIESCYVGLWTDIDFDGAEENFPGVDTSVQLGYCWDGNPNPMEPFAVGYTLLYGPAVPDPESSALRFGRPATGFKNLPLSSFYGIIFSGGPVTWFTGGPYSLTEAWNVARGYDRVGNVILDSVTHQPTRFPYSGDPVTRSGWVYNQHDRKGEEGFLMFCGPFNFAPGDSQWMLTALVPANAGDPMASLTMLRSRAWRLRGMTYDELASPLAVVPPPVPIYSPSPMLLPNFPNPFNASTVIQYAITRNSEVRLAVYDLLGREVALLVNEKRNLGMYQASFDGTGFASGVYITRLTAGGYSTSRAMVLLK